MRAKLSGSKTLAPHRFGDAEVWNGLLSIITVNRVARRCSFGGDCASIVAGEDRTVVGTKSKC